MPNIPILGINSNAQRRRSCVQLSNARSSKRRGPDRAKHHKTSQVFHAHPQDCPQSLRLILTQEMVQNTLRTEVNSDFGGTGSLAHDY